MDKVLYYQDAAGEWRWKRVAPNNEIIADSSEGYKNYQDCFDMGVHVNGFSTVEHHLPDGTVYDYRDWPDGDWNYTAEPRRW